MKLLTEYTTSKDFNKNEMLAGYILGNGSFVYVDEYHNEEDNPYKHLGLPEFSSTHLDDICVRIYKEPNTIQYKQLEKIIDSYLDNYYYCKIELYNNLYSPYFYKAYAIVDDNYNPFKEDEIIGNWTGYNLVQIIKNNINKNAFNESIREDYPTPKKLYDIKDNKAYWPEDAEDFIWWGSEAEGIDNYAKSYKVTMSPKDFLDLTTIAGADKIELGDDIGLSPAEKLDIDKLNKERYQPLFLQIAFKTDDVAKVTGHEGRHRAFALMDAGIKEVDVELRPDTYDTPYNKYHPFIPKQLMLIDQFDQHRHVIVDNPIVMSWKNHKAIRPNLKENLKTKLLFHGTTLAKAISILDNNTLKASANNYYNIMVSKKPSISFSRDLNFIKNMPLGDHPIIFVLDADKLKNNYKIIPISDNKNNALGPRKARYSANSKAEEIIEKDIVNIKKYIIKILCKPSDIDAFRNFDDMPYEKFYDINNITTNKLTEGLLLEMNRNQLIQKSKKSDYYKDTSKGRNRWERRNKSKIASRVDQYNKIDMNDFFKNDQLKVGINVKGETNNYVVLIRYEGALREIQQQILKNNNKLEFKCILIALQRVFNAGNVFVSCSCPDWQYRQAYQASRGGYNSGPLEIRASNITNPKDTKGAGCKHVNLVLGNIDWLMKVASVINNYIYYMKDHFERKYADFIFPKLFGISYDKAVQLNLFDTDDNLSSDQDEIKLSNRYGRERTRFNRNTRVNNMKNFGGKPKPIEENPNQVRLELGLTKAKEEDNDKKTIRPTLELGLTKSKEKANENNIDKDTNIK